MARRSIKGLFDQAQRALAGRSERALLDAFDARYRDPETFLNAVRDFAQCEYYWDAGFKTLAAYARAVIPNTRRGEWNGWEALSHIEPPPEIFELIRTGALKPDKLHPLKDLLTPTTYRSWIFLALHLTRSELSQAVRAYRALLKANPPGEPLVFVPTWVPLSQYRRQHAKANTK